MSGPKHWEKRPWLNTRREREKERGPPSQVSPSRSSRSSDIAQETNGVFLFGQLSCNKKEKEKAKKVGGQARWKIENATCNASSRGPHNAQLDSNLVGGEFVDDFGKAIKTIGPVEIFFFLVFRWTLKSNELETFSLFGSGPIP